MKRRIHVVLAFGLLLTVPAVVFAQSDDTATPLGDIARALRKKKAPEPQAQQVIDNDNLGKVMEQGETDHLKGKINFALSGASRESRTSAPDVTCSLSFNAQSADVNDASGAQDLPHGELAKLDGPAVVNGDAFDLTVYNGTGWSIHEITVGLTIVRRADAGSAAYYGSAKLLPASAGVPATGEKHADMTVLYHLKGSAAPFSSAVFHQSLGASLSPDQDWHWAIVQAQGLPPRQ